MVEFMLFAKKAPKHEKIIANILKFIATFMSINLFFMWIIKINTAIIQKASKFIPCAIFWLKPRTVVNNGIRSVPPPIPIPARIPESNPVKIKYNQNISITYTTILNPAVNKIIIKIHLTTDLFNFFNPIAPIHPPIKTPIETNIPS